MPYGNNKDEDEPVHLRSLINIFVIPSLSVPIHVVIRICFPGVWKVFNPFSTEYLLEGSYPF